MGDHQPFSLGSIIKAVIGDLIDDFETSQKAKKDAPKPESKPSYPGNEQDGVHPEVLRLRTELSASRQAHQEALDINTRGIERLKLAVSRWERKNKSMFGIPMDASLDHVVVTASHIIEDLSPALEPAGFPQNEDKNHRIEALEAAVVTANEQAEIDAEEIKNLVDRIVILERKLEKPKPKVPAPSRKRKPAAKKSAPKSKTR